MDRLVAAAPPFALPPVTVVVVHFRAVGGVLGIAEGFLETALSALSDEEDNKRGNGNDSRGCSTAADADLGSGG